MPGFSRWIPPMPKGRTSPIAMLLLGLVGATLLAAFVYFPAGRFILALLIVVGVGSSLYLDRYYRRLAAVRVGEDIGTFARALDRRSPSFDPWVVRAVWEALQPYVTYRGGRVPLRPTDELVEQLHVDPEDLELVILPEVAWRAGRSLDGITENPRRGRVATVGDLIDLVAFQPRRGAA